MERISAKRLEQTEHKGFNGKTSTTKKVVPPQSYYSGDYLVHDVKSFRRNAKM